MSACADTRPNFAMPSTFNTQGTSTAPPVLRHVCRGRVVTVSDIQQTVTSRPVSVAEKRIFKSADDFTSEFSDAVYVGHIFPRTASDLFDAGRVERAISQWIVATKFSSSLDESRRDPHFETIRAFGWSAVKGLLQRMSKGEARLQCAELLEVITGDDPVNETDLGSAKRIGEAWLRWGRARGFA